jgi:small subunit ribosomal protein S1
VEGGFLLEIDEVMTGYLPYKELSWERIEDPSSYLKIGEKIKVKPLSYEPGKERLRLSIKAILPDPWERVSQKYKEGDIVEGKIIQIFDFGAFVELEPGVEGFIPAREITWNRKIKVNEVLEKGDTVSVFILEVNLSERKLLLSLRKLQPDPWIEAAKNYKVGDIVEGTIEKILPSGLLVELNSEITAFMPLKEFSEEIKILKKNLSEIEGFKIGDKIKGKIIGINPEKRRIQISYLKYLKELENKEIEKYKIQRQEKGETLLTLGDILAKKLVQKNRG